MTYETIKVSDDMSWQPIETAPKGDSYVAVWPPTWAGVLSCAKWDEDKYAKRLKPFWNRIDDMCRIGISRAKPPTHWAPVPDGPCE